MTTTESVESPRNNTIPPARGAAPSPMMRQFWDAKSQHQDALLLFHMGDFYETFHEDAHTCARVLDLALTSRDKGDGGAPMAGFPVHALAPNLARLIGAGLKVAICDQLEDPKLAKGLVKRGITRVVTPGTVLEDESLDARAPSYVATLWPGTGRERWGLAFLDVTRGEFVVTSATDRASALSELSRRAPREVLLPPHGEALEPAIRQPERRVERRTDEAQWSPDLPAPLSVAEGSTADVSSRRAASGLWSYVLGLNPASVAHVSVVRPYTLDEQLLMDEATVAHLELLRTNRELKRAGSLVGVVDETVTVMGSRQVAAWLVAPSRQLSVIRERHDAVEAFLTRTALRSSVRDMLKSVGDLERLVARAAAGVATPRDLGTLRDSLLPLPSVEEALASDDAVAAWGQGLGALQPLCQVLCGALVDKPPPVPKDGGIFRPGYNAKLDELRDLHDHAKDKLAALEAQERTRTNIPSLKVGYSKVFGYFFEVTRTHLAKVPADFIRKQTVANGERFFTPELKDLEERLSHAEDERLSLEDRLFVELRSRVARDAAAVLSLAEQVARLDAVMGFAEVAERRRYRRPEMVDGEADRALPLEIVAGRHAVLETRERELGEPYVPSDVHLSADARQVTLVTGPNMAGKSTAMRMVALCQVLAQAGSFVPAEQARITVADQIFTRMGASDDLLKGQSTFMVEMLETSRILSRATRGSLILLDEIGRGTSTYDGLALAWAIVEHVHETVGARTLFATHYHELTELGSILPRLRNVHTAAKEWEDRVIFLRKLVDGPAERSYGIQVARLAGLPEPVLNRAREVLSNLEASDAGGGKARGRAAARRKNTPQLGLFEAPSECVPPTSAVPDARLLRLRTELEAVDINNLTPLQALNLLSAWKTQLR